MLNLGVIGTNWITHSFVESALKSGMYQLTAVYSRTLEKAEAFRSEYENVDHIQCFTSLSELCESDSIDVVYIASPNSLHYEQAKQLIIAGKHVIVEKPAVSTSEELEELITLSENQDVFFFEAARHMHEDNFKTVLDFLKHRTDIQGAHLNFAKYSSRYDDVLAGNTPNIFSTEYSGGALMDLGVYLVYAAVSWFGVPDAAVYYDQKLPTDVDGMGTAVFQYDTFNVFLNVGKNIDSYLPSEIYLQDGTLCLDAINSIQSVVFKKRTNGEVIEESLHTDASPTAMIDEAIAFAHVMNHPQDIEAQKKYQQWIQLARDVHKIIEKMRHDSNIYFLSDTKENRG